MYYMVGHSFEHVAPNTTFPLQRPQHSPGGNSPRLQSEKGLYLCVSGTHSQQNTRVQILERQTEQIHQQQPVNGFQVAMHLFLHCKNLPKKEVKQWRRWWHITEIPEFTDYITFSVSLFYVPLGAPLINDSISKVVVTSPGTYMRQRLWQIAIGYGILLLYIAFPEWCRHYTSIYSICHP